MRALGFDTKGLPREFVASPKNREQIQWRIHYKGPARRIQRATDDPPKRKRRYEESQIGKSVAFLQVPGSLPPIRRGSYGGLAAKFAAPTMILSLKFHQLILES